jgi:hypothetical protein
MTPYIATIVLLLAFAVAETELPLSPEVKRAMRVIAFVVLVLQVGLRWETGTDWNPYLFHFESINDISTVSPSLLSPEYGYNFSVWAFKKIDSSYSLFLIIHALVYYLLIFNSIELYDGMIFLPLMLFYCTTMGVTGSNRQLIAVAIGLFALRYIVENNRKRYFILVGVACMFHLSAVILLILPLLKDNFPIKGLAFAFICALGIGISPLPQLAFTTMANVVGGEAVVKAAIYTADSTNSLSASGLSLAGLLKRIIFVILFVYNRKRLSMKLPHYSLMLNVYILGVILYFATARSLPIVLTRGSLYCDILEPLLLGAQLHLLRRPSNRLLMVSGFAVLSFFYFLQSISPYPDLFLPYKGLGVNTQYSRAMY